jgi:hypothetical protein
VFAVEDSATPEIRPTRRTAEKEMLQTDRDYKPAPRGAAPSRARRAPDVGRKSSGLPVGLLIGGAVVLGGLFLLLFAGGVIAWFLLRSPTPDAGDAPLATIKPVEPGNAPPPVPEAARQITAAPQAVPEAPAAADAGEEFVDLPERGENMPGVAGLKPDQPQGPGGPPGMPVGRQRVALTNARAVRVPGRSGMVFQVDYRFEEGMPAGGLRYHWVIVTARGQAFKQSLGAGQLRDQGTLQGRALGAGWVQGPYQTYLAVEVLVPGRAGLQDVKISDVLTIR